MVSTLYTDYTDCEHCGATFGQPDDPGRKRRFCSGACRTGACRTGACRTAAHRACKRQQEQAEHERQRRAHEQARDHARHQREREDQERRQRQRERARQRASQPPPHVGTSRPRVFCGACGGLRATHPPPRRRPRARPPPLRRPAHQGRLHHLRPRGRRLHRQGQAAPRQVRPLALWPATTDRHILGAAGLSRRSRTELSVTR
jgi:hypothetical protein